MVISHKPQFSSSPWLYAIQDQISRKRNSPGEYLESILFSIVVIDLPDGICLSVVLCAEDFWGKAIASRNSHKTFNDKHTIVKSRWKLHVAKHHGTSSSLTERFPKSKKITITASRITDAFSWPSLYNICYKCQPTLSLR